MATIIRGSLPNSQMTSGSSSRRRSCTVTAAGQVSAFSEFTSGSAIAVGKSRAGTTANNNNKVTIHSKLMNAMIRWIRSLSTSSIHGPVEPIVDGFAQALLQTPAWLSGVTLGGRRASARGCLLSSKNSKAPPKRGVLGCYPQAFRSFPPRLLSDAWLAQRRSIRASLVRFATWMRIIMKAKTSAAWLQKD